MKTIAAAVGFLLEKLSKEGCSCTLSASLLLLMASGSSDLLNSSLESNLISRFPGNFNRSIPFFPPSLRRFLRVSQTFKSSYCSPAVRIEFLGVEILAQPFLGAGPGSWEYLLQPSQ